MSIPWMKRREPVRAEEMDRVLIVDGRRERRRKRGRIMERRMRRGRRVGISKEVERRRVKERLGRGD